jgi:histidine kinase/histidine kinase/DNA gyrase B/HSP90-like ATPase
MHPILAQRGRLTLYIISWLLAGILLAIMIRSEAPIAPAAALLLALPLALTHGFLCLSAWYVARGMPLGGTGTVRMTATAITAAIVTTAAWVLVARGWVELLKMMDVAVEPAAAPAIRMLASTFGFLMYALSLAISYVFVVYEQSRDAERRGFEVQVLAREAELRSLRAQIDPHFLFNSLHSISALTTIDAQAARRMSVLLADFLRESLTLGAETEITLAQEFRLAERYLDVERIRFDERLRVMLDVGDAGDALVPPLLLQPIVENAVTHGIAQTVEGGVLRMIASRTAGAVRVIVENPCDPDRPKGTGTGVGLANVRARLRALHGGEAWVTTSEAGGVFRAELALPLRTQPAADGPRAAGGGSWTNVSGS